MCGREFQFGNATNRSLDVNSQSDFSIICSFESFLPSLTLSEWLNYFALFFLRHALYFLKTSVKHNNHHSSLQLVQEAAMGDNHVIRCSKIKIFDFFTLFVIWAFQGFHNNWRKTNLTMLGLILHAKMIKLSLNPVLKGI